MLRILHIVTSMNRGGIETLIMSLYRKIDRTKVQFDFLVHTDKEGAYDQEIVSLGGKIFRITPRNKGFLKNRRGLINFFKEHAEYKIIHLHISSLSYIAPIKIAQKFCIPVRIIHGHSTSQGGHKIHIMLHYVNKLKAKNNATHFFACSEDAAKWMYGPNRLFGFEYSIIKNAIDPEKFLYDVELRNLIRKELDLTDKFVLGHVGRFAKQKNHEFIVDIFEEVKKNESQAVLMLVGDGELKEQIAEKIKLKGLADSVVFTGVRSDIAALMNAMDVFLFPSLHEGLGIVGIEAQATGLKTFISTGVPEEVIITNNVKRISLEKAANEWAQEILVLKDGYDRKSETNQVRSNNYDINDVASWIQELYINLDGEL